MKRVKSNTAEKPRPARGDARLSPSWRLQTTNALLGLMLRRHSRRGYLLGAARLLSRATGCRAVGIRLLNTDGQVPYEASVGLSKNFLRSECWLTLGVDECACTRVIRGRLESADARATWRHGAFLTDDARALVAGLRPEQRERFRGRCIRAGYRTLFVVPLRRGGKTLGAIHLADRRPGVLYAHMARFIESLCPIIAEAAQRFTMEDALKESERRYRAIFEKNPAVKLLTDPETGQIVAANAGAGVFYGYAPAQLVGMPLNAVSALPAGQARRNLRVALAGRVHRFVSVHRLASGALRDVEIQTGPVTVQGRRLLYSIIHDITDRVRAERALAASNEMLDRIFTNMHMPVVYLDTEFNFLRVNAAYARACAREPEFFVGKNHFGLYPDAENEAIFRKALRTGKPQFAVEKAFKFPDHPEWDVTYWDWSVQPVRAAEGRTAGLLFCLMDVTARKKAQKALAESERLFRAIFDNAFQFVWLVGADGTLIEANHTALEFMGAERASVVRRKFWDTLFWRGSALERAQVRDACRHAADGVFVRYDTHIAGAGESRLTMDLSLTPVKNEAGRVVTLLVEGRDITEPRRLQKMVAEVSDEERARIGRELHDTLGQHLTAASFLSEALAADLAARSVPEAPTARRVGEMLSHMIGLTRSLARGLCPADLTSGGLTGALEQLSRDTQALFPVQCTFRATEDIHVDDDTVAMNLYHIAQEAITNAVRHSGTREIALRLSRSKSGLSLSVQDSGNGIASERAATEGIGLRIMRHRAASIGGVADIRPAPNGGTLVTCWLPLTAVSQQEIPDAAV